MGLAGRQPAKCRDRDAWGYKQSLVPEFMVRYRRDLTATRWVEGGGLAYVSIATHKGPL